MTQEKQITPEEFIKNNPPLLPIDEIRGTGYLHMPEVYKAMQEYAEQYHRERVKGLTDELEMKLIDAFGFIRGGKEIEAIDAKGQTNIIDIMKWLKSKLTEEQK